MKIFLSAAPSLVNRDLADAVLRDLKAAGHELARFGCIEDIDCASAAQIAIDESDAVIAVFEPKNSNLMFEIGYTVGVGRPLLVVVNRDDRLPAVLHRNRAVFWESDSQATAARVLEWVAEVGERSSGFLESPNSGYERLLLWKESPASFERMTPQDFEGAIGELLGALQFQVRRSIDVDPTMGDFIVEDAGKNRVWIVECKKQKLNSPASIGDVQQLLGAVRAARATKGLLISASGFSHATKEYARRANGELELWDMADVLQKVQEVVHSRGPAVASNIA